MRDCVSSTASISGASPRNEGESVGRKKRADGTIRGVVAATTYRDSAGG